MNISVRFLEPLRMSLWADPDDRTKSNKTFMRGRAFAQWHKSRETKQGRPFIPGTLLRSAVIRAAETLLVLSEGLAGEKPCCQGYFETRDKTQLLHQRQRATLTWPDLKVECSPANPCPLCEILGKFDEAGKRAKKKDGGFHIHFGNLNLPNEPWFENQSDAGKKRVLNRVDDANGKAHDFFEVWELDHVRFPMFGSEITIGQSVSHEGVEFLKDCLRFVDRLCGAQCIVEFDGEKFAEEMSEKKDRFATNPAIKSDIYKAVKTLSPDIIRKLADAILMLREKKEKTHSLPMNHEGKKAHYLWDKGENKTIRDLLESKADEIVYEFEWRRFCEDVGQALYEEAKDAENRQSSPGRILGAANRWGEPEKSPISTKVLSETHHEIIVSGTLIAETPFFFGHEDMGTDQDQTDLQLLLDSQGRFRMPRSALRGAFRRDLKAIVGGGCDTEIGRRPCLCNVCRIMRDVTFMDARSESTMPPEIRHRIRINPYTGTVQEGALFTMEVGLQGVEFPFQLRYRGKRNQTPDDLIQVLDWWSNGYAFLSGASATGKGRFKLAGLKYAVINLDDTDSRREYLTNRGWRPLGKLKGLMKSEGNYGLPVNSRAPFPWRKIPVTINIKFPFINGDPVRALVEGDGADMVSFMTYRKCKGEKAYAYKGESLRVF